MIGSVLHVRQAQMEVLRVAAIEAFARTLAVELRARLPHRCDAHDEAALAELIVLAVDRAEGYGISDPEEIVAYVELAVSHGLGFESREPFEWAGVLLDSASLSGSVKLALLLDRLPERYRPEAP